MMTLGWGLWLYSLTWLWGYLVAVDQHLSHEVLIGFSMVSLAGLLVGLICIIWAKFFKEVLNKTTQTILIWVLPAHIISEVVLVPLFKILHDVNFTFG